MTHSPVYLSDQSNPTFFVRFGGADYVLRKKPPGKLLRGAHAVEREYAVTEALGRAGVPVPKVPACLPAWDDTVLHWVHVGNNAPLAHSFDLCGGRVGVSFREKGD